MRATLFCCLLLVSAGPLAQAAEPEPVAPVPAPVETEVVPATPPPERPKPAARPVEKPRPPVVAAPIPPEPVKPAPVEAARSEPARPDNPDKANDTAPPAGSAASGARSIPLGSWGLAFAMLLIGFVAGFFWRHQMSRRKLGGMSVRIGTWRGIP